MAFTFTTQVVPLLELIKNKWNHYFISIMVLLATLIGQIITIVTFICPCVSLNEVGDNCTLEVKYVIYHGDSCVRPYNKSYSYWFLYGPAGCLFCLGLASNIYKPMSPNQSASKSRKFCDCGCCDCCDCYCCAFLWKVMKVLFYSLFHPLVWICIAFLDGKYYACATTRLPYDVDRYNGTESVSFYENCEAVAGDDYKHTSNLYNYHRTESQNCGWKIILVSSVVCFVIYLVTKLCLLKCDTKLNPQEIYDNLYYEHEEAEIKAKLKELAIENAKENANKLNLTECWIEKKEDKVDDTNIPMHDVAENHNNGDNDNNQGNGDNNQDNGDNNQDN